MNAPIAVRRALLAVCCFLFSAPLAASAQSDSAAVGQIVDAFHTALVATDSTAAMALLAPTAVVLEGGYLETRADYAAGHLGADMAFLSGMEREIIDRRIRIEGDLAWVSTTSHMAGTYYGKQIDSNGAELMVLSRHESGWLIEAIHWSSAR